MAINSEQIARDVLAAVGGKDNVSNVSHCMTRLRFNLKDMGIPKEDEVKKIKGVLGVAVSGGQYQIIIGTSVDKVYNEVCKQGQFTAQKAVSENLDGAVKQKPTPKTVVNDVMGTISSSITPVLPAFIVAGIFKMIAVFLGPKNLGILPDTSDLYALCNLVSNVGYYYLPFYIAYSAAKKLNCNSIMAMMFAGVMIHPDMLSIVASGEPFNVFGIPMDAVNYTQAVFPIIIIVWAMSYVEKLLKKIVPGALRPFGIPVLTMAIMLPVGLCLLGPVCSVVMGWVANGLVWMTENIGIPTMVVVGAIWSWVIVFGMHVPVMTALLPSWMEMGYDAIVSPASLAAHTACLGVSLGYALRAGGKENRSIGWSSFVTAFTANITEPYLYGIFIRDWKASAWHMIGGAMGSLVMGILGAKVVMFTGVGFSLLNFLRFGEYAVQGAIGMAVSFAVSFGLSLIFGFSDSREMQSGKKGFKQKAKDVKA